jgi:zinc protease
MRDEITRKVDAPFLSAGAYGGARTPAVTSFTLGASVQDGRIERGLAALELEANRVEQHGFGTGELDRARKWMLASYDRAYAERDKTESGSYVQEYVNHFLQGELTPGIGSAPARAGALPDRRGCGAVRQGLCDTSQ